MSPTTRQRIVHLSLVKHSGPSAIVERLRQQDISVSRQAVSSFLRKFETTRSIISKRKPRPPKLDNFKGIIDNLYRDNDKLSSTDVKNKLARDCYHLEVSASTIRKCRQGLGWVRCRAKTSQMVRHANQAKRLSHCETLLPENDTFNDVIFTDECSVQLHANSELNFRKKGQGEEAEGASKTPRKGPCVGRHFA